MERDDKTIEQRPDKWEQYSRRFRNLSAVVFGLGVAFGAGVAILLGGTAAIGGELIYESEKDARKDKTVFKAEEKK